MAPCSKMPLYLYIPGATHNVGLSEWTSLWNKSSLDVYFAICLTTQDIIVEVFLNLVPMTIAQASSMGWKRYSINHPMSFMAEWEFESPSPKSSVSTSTLYLFFNFHQCPKWTMAQDWLAIVFQPSGTLKYFMCSSIKNCLQLYFYWY